MKMIGFYIVAASLEIVGCFSFWVWRRNGQSALWTIPGSIALLLFALTLTRIDTANAGRAYAAYGGVYIVASLVWLWCVEGVRPDSWDILGASLCLIGASVILFGPHRHLP